MILPQHKYTKIFIRSLTILIILFAVPVIWASLCSDLKYNSSERGKILSWVSDPNSNTLCHGYFLEPILDSSGAPILPPKQSPTIINANYGSFSQKQPTTVVGNVVVTQPGRRLEADKANLFPDPKTGKIYQIDLFGNVHAYEPGKLVISNKAHFNLENKTGELDNVYYRVALISNDQPTYVEIPISKEKVKIANLTAWGKAKKAIQDKPKHSIFLGATYSTCAPDAALWQLMASKIKLDKINDTGSAYNVTLFMGGAPVFYTPYLNFPLSKKRKSGFLFPIIGSSTNNGLDVGLPFYWNIAPNYDDTITPTYYSKRGVLYDNLFRYLTPHSYGFFKSNYIPNDKEFKEFQQSAATNPSFRKQFGFSDLESASDNRYFINWKDNSVFNEHWSSAIDFAQVSDDYYLQDFGDVPEEISTNNLLRQGLVQYRDEHWVFIGEAQSYQTLHPVNRQQLPNPYARLPDLILDGSYPDAIHGLNLLWHSEGVRFTRPFGPGQPIPDLEANRGDVRPGVSLPVNWAWGYFQPTLYYDETYYDLQSKLPNVTGLPSEFPLIPLIPPPGTELKNINRDLPIFDFDSGIYFDRDFNFANTQYQQTLEPELFYLNVPFHNQNNIPVFDSGVIPFDYGQLFSINRFSGYDRIGDANQLTLALTTRINNENTGEEKFRLSVGRIYYFQNRRVTLCTAENCSDFLTGMGTTSPTEPQSPIASLVSYHVNPTFSVNGDWAYDPRFNDTITASTYLSYMPAFNHIIDLGYNFIRNGDIDSSVLPGNPRNDLQQISVGSSLPLNINWNAVGVFNYAINQRHPQTYYAGLEYNNCCIRMRFVGGRVYSNINENGDYIFHNAVYFQIQLKGLGNLGSNSISSIITSGIPGYVDPFQHSSWKIE